MSKPKCGRHGERADRQSGHCRTAVDQQHRPADERAREEPVLSIAERPGDRGKGHERNQYRPAALVEDGAADQEKRDQRRDLKEDEGAEIGQPRHHGAQHQKDRRIVEIDIGNADRGGGLLGGIVPRLVIGELRRAGVGQRARGIEAGKIRRRRMRQPDDPFMLERDEKHKGRDLEHEQDAAIEQHPPAVEPDALPAIAKEQPRPGAGGYIHGASVSIPTFAVIASAAKQSPSGNGTTPAGDWFAALAMTGLKRRFRPARTDGRRSASSAAGRRRGSGIRRPAPGSASARGRARDRSEWRLPSRR